jgi:transcriptional regulator with XRE-family HTH domain
MIGGSTNTVDLQLFYKELDAHRQQQHLSWRQVATQAEVSSTTLIRMAQGVLPDPENLAKLKKWLKFLTCLDSKEFVGDRVDSTWYSPTVAPSENSAYLTAIKSIVRAGCDRMKH